tara:strand:+ start:204 stop:743 length:540 start_codon:yes stop_codon:yes gene_type:complete
LQAETRKARVLVAVIHPWETGRDNSVDWDNAKLHDASPFQIVDPGFNGILRRSCADLADELAAPDIAARSRAHVAKGIAAMESLWSDDHGQYVCWDRKADVRVDSLRYWRGPVWLIVNYMIVDGLQVAGETATADRIIADSRKLIEHRGFAENYDPIDGTPCGGGRFTWTAAMVIEFIQ